MPRGQKSKLRAREKRRQAHGETLGLQGAQAPAAAEDKILSSSLVFEGTPQNSSYAGSPQGPQRSPFTTTSAAAISCITSDEGAKGQDEESPSSFQVPASTKSSRKDPLTRKAGMLVQFLLYKYKMKEPITKADMLKIVNRKYKDHFPEILKRTSERMELIFGLDLKQEDSRGQSYALVSKLDLTNEENLSGAWGFPKSGLLMPLLGVIFINGNCATEEEIWEFLNMLGIYDGKRHFIFGDTRKLITRDLVREKYLEYRQVPNTDPPRYEFLWGPRAHAETSKMKVLEFLAKVNDTVPSAFQSRYEEALRDEEARAGARVAGRAGSIAIARALPRIRISCFSRFK
ncbi:melanoma-associated antigen B4-like [Dasypus novemcinctus]|uniref:melanoma-associated antigen B4-like n=1 Tax=Dasypus novemcinctus TaxID=9361 RepID=UPI0000E36439|nr:melanoma-associated antigen B4-like [Dasypus novemcinctus]